MSTMTTTAQKTIGVLALQGDYSRHLYQIGLIGDRGVEIRTPAQLDEIDGLIIPGGESTTMDILMDRFELRPALTEFAATKPVWGTCAGMIMLGKGIADNQAGVKPLGLMDIDVLRNGYGRQVFSFEETLEARLDDTTARLHAIFIRAPKIVRAGEGVETLATYREAPVLVRERNLMASSFHTELDDDTTLLSFFVRKFLWR